MTARPFLLLAAFGCAGTPQASVLPTLDSLPPEHVAREQHLAGTATRPAPETQKAKPRGWRKVETAAATAAAVVGQFFSTTKTVTVGVSVPVDENLIVDPDYQKNERKKKPDEPPEETYDPGKLTPWVQLGGGED